MLSIHSYKGYNKPRELHWLKDVSILLSINTVVYSLLKWISSQYFLVFILNQKWPQVLKLIQYEYRKYNCENAKISVTSLTLTSISGFFHQCPRTPPPEGCNFRSRLAEVCGWVWEGSDQYSNQEHTEPMGWGHVSCPSPSSKGSFWVTRLQVTYYPLFLAYQL